MKENRAGAGFGSTATLGLWVLRSSVVYVFVEVEKTTQLCRGGWLCYSTPISLVGRGFSRDIQTALLRPLGPEVR